MKRSTARWTTTLAAATLLAMPTIGLAQTGAPAAQTPPAAAAPGEQPAAAQEHLRKAEETLNSIQVASLAAPVKARIGDLKKSVNKLERAAANQSTAGASAQASASGSVRWDAEVAAIDRTLTMMLGAETTTGAATGTAGKPAMKLDADVRSKLTEFRSHITAFAAAMGGAAAPASSTPPASTEPPPATTGTAQPPASTSSQPPSTTSQPPATAGQPPASTTAQPPASTAPAASASQPNPDEAKKHLTAARNSLSEMTQLPAAAQLSGDARTQVTQLISNFNELITTNVDWRASYAKVEANLSALLGAQTTDESAARTTATGTAGAVGTAGTTTLDPGLRAKLVEVRSHLEKFQEAAGGSKSEPVESAATSTPATNPAAATTPATGTPMSGQQTPAAAHGSQVDHQEVLRHIQAIETILQSSGAAAGTSGTTGTTQPGLTLTAEQTEQLKKHLNDLKRLFESR